MARWSKTTAVEVAVVALLMCSAQAGLAQRGGGHGGFASHSAPHISSGFRASAPRSAMRPTFAPPRSGAVARGFAPRRQFMPTGQFNRNRMPYNPGLQSRSPQYRPDRYRRPYRGDHRHPYVNTSWGLWPGWTVPYYLGYPDDYGFDYDDDQAQQEQPYQEDAYGGAPYDAGTPYADEQQPWPAYPPDSGYGRQPAAAQPAPGAQESITLVFKDGRQPEQIKNYMLTGTTLYVLDQKRREIPIKDLDLVATERVNQDAGVDFHLPAGTP